MGMCPIPYLVFVTDSKWLLIFILCFIGEFVFLSKKESEIDCYMRIVHLQKKIFRDENRIRRKTGCAEFYGIGQLQPVCGAVIVSLCSGKRVLVVCSGTPWKSATLVDGGRKPGNGIGTLPILTLHLGKDFVVARGRYTQDFETGQHTAVPRIE